MARENFLQGYVESDAANKITRHRFDVSWAAFDGIDASYVRKDFGRNHFGDFIHSFKFVVTARANAGTLCIWSLNDGYNSYPALAAADNGVWVYMYHANGRIQLFDFTNDNSDASLDIGNTGTWYFVVSRSGTTLTCDIFNDEAHTDLHDSLSLVCGANRYRYFYPTLPFTWGTGDATVSGMVADMDLGVSEFTLRNRLGLGSYENYGNPLKRIAVRHHTHNRVH